ncbi:MAG: hypothetical protein ACK5VE_03505 [Alphaproteobacteria bacterium]
MAEPYLIEITQGETLFQEFRLVDDDGDAIAVTEAAKSVKSALLPANDFVFANTAEVGTFTIKVLAADTELWPPGVHLSEVWFDWGALLDLRYERIFDVRFSVRKAVS